MMRILKIAALAAVMALPAANAQASVLGGTLSFNGQIDQINTINNPVGLSTFVDGATGAAGVLDAGDLVFGFIASTQVTNDVTLSDPFNPNSPVVIGSGTSVPFGGTSYAASIFSGVVNNGAAPGDTFLTPIDPMAGTGLSIPELLSEFSGVGEQLDGVTNAVAAVLSGSTSGGVSDLTSTTAAGLASFFTEADFDLEFALTTDSGFFQSVLIPPTGLGGPQLGQRAGLNVISGTEGGSFATPGIEFIPVPVTQIFPPPISEADVALDNTFVALDQPANGFAFTIESSSIRLNVIPEATSVVAWLGLATLTAVKTRRRKQA